VTDQLDTGFIGFLLSSSKCRDRFKLLLHDSYASLPIYLSELSNNKKNSTAITFNTLTFQVHMTPERQAGKAWDPCNKVMLFQTPPTPPSRNKVSFTSPHDFFSFHRLICYLFQVSLFSELQRARKLLVHH
jgi:hypothetical protein